MAFDASTPRDQLSGDALALWAYCRTPNPTRFAKQRQRRLEAERAHLANTETITTPAQRQSYHINNNRTSEVSLNTPAPRTVAPGVSTPQPPLTGDALALHVYNKTPKPIRFIKQRQRKLEVEKALRNSTPHTASTPALNLPKEAPTDNHDKTIDTTTVDQTSNAAIVEVVGNTSPSKDGEPHPTNVEQESRIMEECIETALRINHAEAQFSQRSRSLEEYIEIARRKSKITCHTELEDRITAAEQHRNASIGSSPSIDKNKDGERTEDDVQPFGNQEKEELDDMDREFLGITENQFSPPRSKSVQYPTISPRSPKHSQVPSNRDSPESFNLGQELDEEYQGSEERSPKKFQRTMRTYKGAGRKKALRELRVRRDPKQKSRMKAAEEKSNKKQPRTLPVKELVLVSQRVEVSDVENDDVEPIELSDDPISQISSQLSELTTNDKTSKKRKGESRKTLRNLQGNIRRTLFGDIDVSKFHIPRPFPKFPELGTVVQSSPTYSDGFEGAEAQLTGITMPIRRKVNRQGGYQGVARRMGELTLVAKKDSEEKIIDRPRRYRKLKERLSCEDAMLADDSRIVAHEQREQSPFPDHNYNVPAPTNQLASVSQEQCTHKVSTNEKSPTTLSSPLKRKWQDSCKITFDAPIHFEESSKNISFQPPPAEICHSNPTRPIMPEKKSLLRRDKMEAIAAQELSMVYMKKRFDIEDGYDSSEEYCGSAESDSEDSENEDLESEASDAASEDSGCENLAMSEMKVGNEKDESISNDLEMAELEPENETTPEVYEHPTIERHPTKEGKSDFLPDSSRRMSTLDLQQITEATKIELAQVESTLEEVATELQEIESTGIEGKEMDGSWRPRRPTSSNIIMEVDEDIDSCSLRNSRTRASSLTDGFLRRKGGRMSSQPLTIVKTKVDSFIGNDFQHNTQGSIKSRNTRILAPPSPKIPETQCLAQTDISHSSQDFFIPKSSYFERASQTPQQPIPSLKILRTKSMPAFVHSYLHSHSQHSGEREVLARGITMSEAFHYTVSPPKSSQHLSSILEEGPDQAKTLRALTRQASIDLGTTPHLTRRKLMFVPFKPSFLN